MDELGLVQPVDDFRQCIVRAIVSATDRRFNACLGQAFGVADGHVLDAPVGMVAQGIGGMSVVQGLLQGIRHEVCAHGVADTPAHNAPGKHVDDEGHTQPV